MYMTDEYILIHWTCAGLDEARMVSQHLVKSRLVACASIVPWVESIFIWEEQLETCQESRVVFKTRRDLFEKVRAEIISKARYEVPEILAIPIVEGHQEYLDWIASSTSELAC